jgi:hypothetical protein
MEARIRSSEGLITVQQLQKKFSPSDKRRHIRRVLQRLIDVSPKTTQLAGRTNEYMRTVEEFYFNPFMSWLNMQLAIHADTYEAVQWEKENGVPVTERLEGGAYRTYVRTCTPELVHYEGLLDALSVKIGLKQNYLQGYGGESWVFLYYCEIEATHEGESVSLMLYWNRLSPKDETGWFETDSREIKTIVQHVKTVETTRKPIRFSYEYLRENKLIVRDGFTEEKRERVRKVKHVKEINVICNTEASQRNPLEISVPSNIARSPQAKHNFSGKPVLVGRETIQLAPGRNNWDAYYHTTDEGKGKQAAQRSARAFSRKIERAIEKARTKK